MIESLWLIVTTFARLILQGYRVDESIAVLLAMIAMSGRRGFEYVQWLIGARNWIDAHQLIVISMVAAMLSALIVAGSILTVREWRKWISTK